MELNPKQLSMFSDLPDWPGGTAPRNRASSKPSTKPVGVNGARGKVYRIGGVETEFFTVGELAKALGRKSVTIRSWESRGWLPKVKYRTPPPAAEQIPGKPSKGRRLYSRDQVEFLVAAVVKFKLDHNKDANWPGFLQHVKTLWPN